MRPDWKRILRQVRAAWRGPDRRPRRPVRRLVTEQLEDRTLLSINPTVSGGTVTFYQDVLGPTSDQNLRLRTDPANAGALQYATTQAAFQAGTWTTVSGFNLNSRDSTIRLQIEKTLHLEGISEAGKALTIDARSATSVGAVSDGKNTYTLAASADVVRLPLLAVDGNLLTGGSNLTLHARAGIEVASNVVVSTRSITPINPSTPDHVNDPSAGNPGGIASRPSTKFAHHQVPIPTGAIP
jgi:hypothetical protein